MSKHRPEHAIRTVLIPVGAEYCVTSCNLGIFVDQAAEPVPPIGPRQSRVLDLALEHSDLMPARVRARHWCWRPPTAAGYGSCPVNTSTPPCFSLPSLDR